MKLKYGFDVCENLYKLCTKNVSLFQRKKNAITTEYQRRQIISSITSPININKPGSK